MPKPFAAGGQALWRSPALGADMPPLRVEVAVGVGPVDTVVARSDRVAKPVAVRYAWAYNPVCNFANAAGLPASPFRTDDWPGVTAGRK